MTTRAEQLASRLEQGADALAEFAGRLSEAQWRTTLPGDGRPVGVVVHHVASVYPIELDLARTVASGKPIVGITYEDAIRKMNAQHAADMASYLKQDAAMQKANTRDLADPYYFWPSFFELAW